MSHSTRTSDQPAIEKTPYGKLPTGETIFAYRLTNANGMSAVILTLGGIIAELNVPDAAGRYANVTLGCSSLEEYLANTAYFGTITGRIAGRLVGAQFTLDGRTYNLPANSGDNHIHGGKVGLDRRVWTATAAESTATESRLALHYRSPDGEEGYPGNLEITTTYTLTADNTLRIDFAATTDAATPVCLTNHAYFNLTGDPTKTALDHRLKIDASEFVPTDNNLTPTGKLAPVSAGNDFRTSRTIREALPTIWKEHGDMYRLPENPKNQMRTVAELTDPASGRTLSVSTTQRFLQFYSGWFLDLTPSPSIKSTYPKHAGICLECQGFSDGPNHPEIDDIIVRPEKPYNQTIAFTFSAAPPSR